MAVQNELLDQLRGLHLPPQPSWWPPAPGWWLLAGLIISAVTVVLLWKYARPRRPCQKLNATALQARAELDRLRAHMTDGIDPQCLLSRLSTLIRQVAMTLATREEVARLTGHSWLSWLDRRAGKVLFLSEEGRAFACAHYQKNATFEAEVILKICEEWLEIVLAREQNA